MQCLLWGGERVWCNPPYSVLEPWVSKAWRAVNEESAELVVMLVPANRTEQGWWQRLVEPYRDRGGALTTAFLPDRLRFGRAIPVKNDRPPFRPGRVVDTPPGGIVFPRPSSDARSGALPGG
jgi:hypothetical protein